MISPLRLGLPLLILATACGGGSDGSGGRAVPSKRVEVYDPVEDRWTKGTGLPFPVQGARCASIGRVIYLAGGRTSDALDLPYLAYDPVPDSWMQLPPPPIPSPTTVTGHQVVASGTDLYLILPAQIHVFDSLAGTWSLAPLPRGNHQATSPAVAALGGYLYIIEEFANLSERLELVSGTWTTTASVPALIFREAVAHGSLIYTTSWDAIWAYDPALDTWTAGPAPPFFRYFLDGVAVGQEILYVSRGDRKVFSYDTVAQTWTQRRSKRQGLKETAAGTSGGLLFAFGGYRFQPR